LSSGLFERLVEPPPGSASHRDEKDNNDKHQSNNPPRHPHHKEEQNQNDRHEDWINQSFHQFTINMPKTSANETPKALPTRPKASANENAEGVG
jgi:hypothetical protein